MSEIILAGIGICATILVGLIAIGLCIYFGLAGFRGGIMGELGIIKTKVSEIQQTAQNMWDVLRSSSVFVPSGTVERELKNLGKIKITAEPHLEETTYFLDVQKPFFDSARIAKLSKQTDLERKEIEMFDVPTTVHAPIPTRLIIEVPCTDPQICADYMSFFLKWLDSKYFESLYKIEDFEKPIKVN